jgi:hypothetical protein
MWEWINETISSFEECFKRKAAFKWFAMIVIGFMIGREHAGITSIIRELQINPRQYESLLHFFRSSAWCLAEIENQWLRIVCNTGQLFKEACMPILVGDGTKQSKEAKKMPCVKKLFQESENSAKPSYIFGHMFGAIGVLIGNAGKQFCLPLSISIHDGDRQIGKWDDSDVHSVNESHVVRMVREACRIVSMFMPSILLLDRYYLSVPALQALAEAEKKAGKALLTIVTRVKANAKAYEKPVRKPGRGRPPIKGAKVKLAKLFDNCKEQFTQSTILLYGKEETVSFLCKDLLWGDTLYRQLRFVFTIYQDGRTAIFACTNLSFTPEQIIRLYGYRFKIECCFRELKQVIAGFAYRFWSAAMPRLNKYAKSGEDALCGVAEDHHRKLILAAYRAIQRYVMVACIALGLLQIGSLRFTDAINRSPARWLRTKSNSIPSEATTSDYLRKSFFPLIHRSSNLAISRFFIAAQSSH